MSSDVVNTIREILSEVREGYNFNEMALDTTFGDAGLDSLDSASLLLGIQEAFDLQISDDDADELDTIGKVVAYIEKHKAA